MTSDATYSPGRRTALVFVGTGTAGAYHAGVLRALLEAGVRVDLVAGRGMGAVSAFCAAADAGAQLWDERGLWSPVHAARLYEWRPLWRALMIAIAVAVAALLLPIALGLLAAACYPVVLIAQVIAPVRAASLSAGYRDLLAWLLSPELLSSLLPRLATVGLVAGGLLVLGASVGAWARQRVRRRVRGGFWWRGLGAPVDANGALRWATGGFWQFIRGAAHVAQPTAADLSRRYCELVSENLGQPGYRELLLTAHDIDARRDVVFALLAEPFRSAFAAAGADAGRDERLSELIDLAGAGREHAVDALAGALSVPGLCDPHRATFSPESHWRGETHRLCDRPDAVARLLDEVAAAGATQVIVVAAVASVTGPHALSAARLGLRDRIGELTASAEAASLDGAVAAVSHRFWGIYRIAPWHNPLGPFEVRGGYDDRSDRPFGLRELVNRGYEDAYRQFVEPVVGASGESIRTATPVSALAADDLPLRSGPAREG